MPREEILTWEELLQVVQSSVKLGIRKVRLTGGEPLVRTGLVDFVARLGEIPEIDDIAITTNGLLLPKYASKLAKVGLKRVNISLDTMNPERFSRITRGGQLDQVWQGIEVALKEGLQPVKLNCIVMKGVNDDEILDFARLTIDRPLHVRFIELMPIGESSEWAGGARMPVEDVQAQIAKLGELSPMSSGTGSGPAKYYALPGAQGTVGFISPMSQHFCHTCNRIRLTAEGKLRTCLHARREIDLRTPIRQGQSLQQLTQLIAEEITNKPLEHSMVEEGWADNVRVMSQIGG